MAHNGHDDRGGHRMAFSSGQQGGIVPFSHTERGKKGWPPYGTIGFSRVSGRCDQGLWPCCAAPGLAYARRVQAGWTGHGL
ncbi:hypothetical protein CFR75_05705 [Komagataeibacter xylinus]|uniref:Uncharacterized protein n=2 Tax=Komagataeibacter xylinus TaxID=28448 RepID=A0A318PJD2_KOMXY|nr:hypothetical protein CXP35_10085 [Komagataeibacter xylinus]PYD57533.1 hypothetical protein CFR75_05705 [Komagataeibacter xylinus]